MPDFDDTGKPRAGDAAPEPRTVLIAEDDPIVALDLKEQFLLNGYTVSGPFIAAAPAVKSLSITRPNLAVVDYHLRDGVADDLMAALNQSAIPFIIVTVARNVRLPDGVRPLSIFPKPFEIGRLSHLAAQVEAKIPPGLLPPIPDRSDDPRS